MPLLTYPAKLMGLAVFFTTVIAAAYWLRFDAPIWGAF